MSSTSEPDHVAYARYFQDTLECRIVPLWGLRPPAADGGAYTCRCPLGAACGSNAGKHAVGTWKDKPSRLPNAIQNWGYVSDRIVVLDLDTIDVELPWSLPPTWEIGTRKGKHLIYKWFGAPLCTRIRLVPDVDFKAHGGLVVGPGSMRTDGQRYEPLNTRPIAVLPDEIAALSAPWHEPVKLHGVRLNERTSQFAMDTVDRLCEEMSSLGTGSRNSKLFSGLCWLLRSGWAGQDAINRFKDAAISAGLTEREVESAYNSAWKSVFG